MVRRPVRHRRNRRTPDPSQLRRPTFAVATPTVAATKLQLDFDIPVQLNGLPQILVDSVLPVSAVQDSPTRITVDYTAAVVSGQSCVIPEQDDAIRTASGGWAVALTLELP